MEAEAKGMGLNDEKSDCQSGPSSADITFFEPVSDKPWTEYHRKEGVPPSANLAYSGHYSGLVLALFQAVQEEHLNLFFFFAEVQNKA